MVLEGIVLEMVNQPGIMERARKSECTMCHNEKDEVSIACVHYEGTCINLWEPRNEYRRYGVCYGKEPHLPDSHDCVYKHKVTPNEAKILFEEYEEHLRKGVLIA